MKRPLVGLCVGLLMTASAGQATTLVRQNLGNLVDQAELIFVGTVVHTEAVETKDEAFAFTYVTFQVEEAFKGSSMSDELTLRFAGGDLGPERFVVSGVPTFEVGGRHLLFVEGNGLQGCPLVGWWQGKLDFVPHPLSGEGLLVDADRRVVTGVGQKEWRIGSLQLTADGLVSAVSGAGIEVVEEDGVSIELPEVAGAEGAVESVGSSQVLDSLRDFVAKRSGKASFRRFAPVASASPSDVPLTFQFQAYPASR